MRTQGNRLSFLLAIIFSVTQVACAQTLVEQTNYGNSFSFNIFSRAARIDAGFWNAEVDGTRVCIQLSNSASKREALFIINGCFLKNTLSALPSGNGYEIKRETGSLRFEGMATSLEGSGKFRFVEDPQFVSFLDQEGVDRDIDQLYYFKMFLGDISKEYVIGIKQRGYQPTLKELGKLGLYEVSLQYIDDLASVGYKGLELEMIAKLSIHDVTIDYIRQLASLGYEGLDANILKKFAIHDVGIPYLKGLAALGYGDLEPEMVKKFAVHGITTDYIKSLAQAGYGDMDPNMVKKFSIHGISASYINSINKLGLEKASPNALKKAKIHGVTAQFIKRLQERGHQSDQLSDYIKMKVKGV